MFSLRSFIKTGLIGAVGIMADYQIILNAAGWMEKGVLLESDLEEIQTAMGIHAGTNFISVNDESVPENTSSNDESAPEDIPDNDETVSEEAES